MGDPTFYLVPYAVAETRKSRAASGRLRVLASSPGEALERAAAIHHAKNVRGTPANGWSGPGARSFSRSLIGSTSTLGKTMIAAISYGEPVEVSTDPAQRDVLGVEARQRRAVERTRAQMGLP